MVQFEFDYPRTYHLPFSPGMAGDDKMISTLDDFIGKEIVITEKLDGENTTLLRDGFHARSLDSPMNYTRSWVKVLHLLIGGEIPEKWRFCGENLAYYHSIHYTDLDSFFYLFSIWDEHNMRLHWDEIVEWANMLDLALPMVLDRCIFDLHKIQQIAKKLDTTQCEGFVVSLVEPFHYSEFATKTAKYVRANHIQPNGSGNADHWLKSTFPNKIGTGNRVKPKIMEYYTKK